jgi:hypothetical protein
LPLPEKKNQNRSDACCQKKKIKIDAMPAASCLYNCCQKMVMVLKNISTIIYKIMSSMHIGTKITNPKTLGWKQPLGITIGNKQHGLGSNKSRSQNNPGIGLPTNNIMASGHAPFQPVGLNKVANKTLNSKSGLEKN